MTAVGMGAWALIVFLLGAGCGVWLVQHWDTVNYRREQVEAAKREADLAEGRANQARWDEMSAA